MTTPIQSKCCKESIDKNQRYCPKCGWECHIEEMPIGEEGMGDYSTDDIFGDKRRDGGRMKDDTIIGKPGSYCGDMVLEYAPKGTLKELAALRSLVRETVKELRCYCSKVSATVDGIQVPVEIEPCGACKILSRPEVKAIMEEKP